jgi:hypothetical protein
MKKLIIIFAIISIILSSLTGCIFESDDGSNGDDTEPGFSAEELNSPDAGIPQEYLNDFTKPDSTSYGQKVAFKYETTWAFQYNTVYTKLGGVLQLSLKNVGETEMYVYEFGIEPEWQDEPTTRETGWLILPEQEVELGLCAFDGPSVPGAYIYQLKFGILARDDQDSIWTDWGLIGNKSYEVVVEGLSLTPGVQEYEVRSNPKGLYDKVNDLVDPMDSAVRSQAVLLAKKYQGSYNVFQLCEIFNYIRDNVSYVNDPVGDNNYWSTPAETLMLCAGDCEDQALLFSAMIGAISGTSRIYMTDSHAFAAAYMGNSEKKRDGVLIALDQYYGTELQYAWFKDDLGYWLVIDPIGALHAGGLPLGGEPKGDGSPDDPMISDVDANLQPWDFFGTEDLYIIDIK